MLLVCHTSAYRKVAARLRGGMLLLAALPDALSAQQFEHVASLYFTRPFGAPDPLPQVLAIAITDANFGFTSRPLPLRHPARFRRHAPGPVAARHVVLPYFSGRSGGCPLFVDSLQRLKRLRQQHRSWSVRRRRSICAYRKYRTKLRTWSLCLVRQLFRLALSALHMLATDASAAFKSRSTIHLENLAIGRQLGVLRRSVKRPKLTPADRLL